VHPDQIEALPSLRAHHSPPPSLDACRVVAEDQGMLVRRDQRACLDKREKDRASERERERGSSVADVRSATNETDSVPLKTSVFTGTSTKLKTRHVTGMTGYDPQSLHPDSKFMTWKGRGVASHSRYLRFFRV